MKKKIFFVSMLCFFFFSWNIVSAEPRFNREDKSIFLPDIEVKAGIDYFYIDPGTFLPEDDDIKIKSMPFYYFDGKIGWDFRLFNFSVKLKNTFHKDSLKENYINQDSGLENEGDKTRERIINFLGGITPFGDREFRWGLYAQAEFRLFQTEITVDNSINYITDSDTTVLNPDEKYYANMYQRSYYFGAQFIFNEKEALSVGYYFNRTVSPYFLEKDAAIEDVTSTNHSLFINMKGMYGNLILECEGVYGVSMFKKPDGDVLHVRFFYDSAEKKSATASLLYRDNIKNGYYYYLFDHLYLGGYVGYSGYMPLHSRMSLNIASAVLNQAYLWSMVGSTGGFPAIQAPINILFNYGLLKLMGRDPIYADISLGVQAGISF